MSIPSLAGIGIAIIVIAFQCALIFSLTARLQESTEREVRWAQLVKKSQDNERQMQSAFDQMESAYSQMTDNFNSVAKSCSIL